MYVASVSEHGRGGMQDRWERAAQRAAYLHKEAEIREGAPPARLSDAINRTPTYEISAEAFLLRVPNGLVLHYRRGEGVTAARPANVAASDIALFLNGSVYGAIAWINGFIPLHAAAVAHEGRVHAFTAHSGYGKSTLAAALGQRGMPLFTDDVLVLDFSDPRQIICLPGHKQMKLWADALGLTGAKSGAAVRPDMSKYYAVPPGGVAQEPLPLAQLTFLQTQARKPQSPVALKGADRVTRLLSAFYRRHFCAAIIEHRSTFAALARIGAAIPMTVFDRPLEKACFSDGVGLVATAIAEHRHG
jgi:hypothetical protein